ncbi:MAG: glycosyl transferase family 1 [Acidithiobacillales bacterium SM23_46]|nr:MAG: glycosyl transferase family 1 [Acidithiobacillales bacterium SM23_46]
MQRILFLVTEDWYFASHRLPLAMEMARVGYMVSVATRVGRHREHINRAGIRLIPFNLGRRFANPIVELSILWRLIRLYRREQPTVVYHVGLKPVVYGSLAARIAGIAGQINAIAGLGSVFSSRRFKARLVRPLLQGVLRLLLAGRKSRIIVQNRDDQRVVLEMMHQDPERVAVIAGAGVDLNQFAVTDEPAGTPVVLYAGRILWDKGVGYFVEAARRLRSMGIAARFVLVGTPDEGNPSAVPLAQIENWQRAAIVEWWGQHDDMPAVFAASHMVCLPSYYGEGIPKVLIEAAASGRAIVTTDIAGCREIVRHETNGLLVCPHDVDALANALARLIASPEERRRMGTAGRKIAEAEYGLELINRQSLAVVEAVAA